MMYLLQRWIDAAQGWFRDKRYQEVRNWIQEHPAVVIGVCAVMLVISLMIPIAHFRDAPTTSTTVPTTWYFDLGAGELFTDGYDRVPPFEPPSGAMHDGQPAAVVARVFACGSCETENLFIGWLERYDQQGQMILNNLNMVPAVADRGNNFPQHIYIASAPENGRPGAVTWHRYDSPQAEAIRHSAMTRCGGGEAVECQPNAEK